MTTERRYTDRDVRENPSLHDLVIDYLCEYGGDFEPLVNAQALLKNTPLGEDLPTNIVRVVLNCMRHDHNVATLLPPPIRPRLEIVRPRIKKAQYYLDCDNQEPHEGHFWGENDGDRMAHHCSGVEFEINRDRVLILNAKVKLPYVRAGVSELVHMTTGQAWSYWYLVRNDMHVFDELVEATHQYGPRRPEYLSIKTVCKYPSIINRGRLLDVDEKNELINSKVLNVRLCPHCVKATMTE